MQYQGIRGGDCSQGRSRKTEKDGQRRQTREGDREEKKREAGRHGRRGVFGLPALTAHRNVGNLATLDCDRSNRLDVDREQSGMRHCGLRSPNARGCSCSTSPVCGCCGCCGWRRCCLASRTWRVSLGHAALRARGPLESVVGMAPKLLGQDTDGPSPTALHGAGTAK